MTATTQAPAVVELAAADLNAHGRIHCPHPKAGMELWNSHPRVFLDLSHTGQAQCPYCGTVYRLHAAASAERASSCASPKR
ncbi:Zinc-finger domain protein [Tepidimonas fonticaldi]|uniref:Zinc-finger domain protein n=1 Tax=Tepidimonas fonticaldi TaxID=1101373 RepID=A0A554XLM2_9BURK|nr:zinc-finger domain-containing protein [Tepidimonas fonticaldi]TSE36677.1 Zinc-finger domain protein [Tepidimonas fonticaldi]